LLIVLTTLVGAVAGLFVGQSGIISIVDRNPGMRRTMGAESDGVAELLFWVVEIIIGVIGGTIIGLILGVIVSICLPRWRGKRGSTS